MAVIIFGRFSVSSVTSVAMLLAVIQKRAACPEVAKRIEGLTSCRCGEKDVFGSLELFITNDQPLLIFLAQLEFHLEIISRPFFHRTETQDIIDRTSPERVDHQGLAHH